MTPLLKTYLERIRTEHKKLDARGVMQMHRQVDMALDDIYVTLNASIKREGTGGIVLGGPSGIATRALLGRVDDPWNRLIESVPERTTDEGGSTSRHSMRATDTG